METKTTNPRRAEMRQVIEAGKDAGMISNEPGSVNAWLMSCYKRETGQTDFRTFKAWKDAGYSVKKGERGFPIFSRPISIIKAEQGKESETDENAGKFGTAYLFHAGQVNKINENQ